MNSDRSIPDAEDLNVIIQSVQEKHIIFVNGVIDSSDHIALQI